MSTNDREFRKEEFAASLAAMRSMLVGARTGRYCLDSNFVPVAPNDNDVVMEDSNIRNEGA